MSEAVTDKFARRIAENVATYEEARGTLRDAKGRSPVLAGLSTGFVVSAAVFFLSPESSSPLWIQIMTGIAGVWAIAACIFHVRKYRQLRRAIDVVLAKRDAHVQRPSDCTAA